MKGKKVNGKNVILTDENQLKSYELIESGYTFKKISEIFGISESTVQLIKNRKGRKLQVANKKYQVNDNYFEKIDTEEKAYWLGFLYADGNVRMHKGRSGILKLKLKQSDKDHIEKFNKCLDSNYSITDGVEIVKSKGKIYKCFCSTLVIYNTKLVKDLCNYGCVENKTFKIKFPELKSKLIRHFIRGFFDGDGSVSTYDNNYSKGGRMNMVSGSHQFLKECCDFLVNNLNLTNNEIKNHETYYTIEWGGRIDIELIFNFFYKNSNIYLDRKKKKFEEAVKINSLRKRYRKKNKHY